MADAHQPRANAPRRHRQAGAHSTCAGIWPAYGKRGRLNVRGRTLPGAAPGRPPAMRRAFVPDRHMPGGSGFGRRFSRAAEVRKHARIRLAKCRCCGSRGRRASAGKLCAAVQTRPKHISKMTIALFINRLGGLHVKGYVVPDFQSAAFVPGNCVCSTSYDP